MTNTTNNVLYVGMTNDIARRIYEHQNKLVKGLTEKYNVSKLIYAEEHPTAYEAITRGKQLKDWRHSKKTALIHEMNPTWQLLEL